jgi:hypothetical protein
LGRLGEMVGGADAEDACSYDEDVAVHRLYLYLSKSIVC